jgi:hypothetical protein
MIYVAARPTHGTNIFVGDRDELVDPIRIKASTPPILPGQEHFHDRRAGQPEITGNS